MNEKLRYLGLYVVLIEKMKSILVQHAHDNWRDFLDEDGCFVADMEPVLEYAFEKAKIDYDDAVKDAYASVILERHEWLFQETYQEVKEIVNDEKEDYKQWIQATKSPEAMLRFHGMSIKDFL